MDKERKEQCVYVGTLSRVGLLCLLAATASIQAAGTPQHNPAAHRTQSGVTTAIPTDCSTYTDYRRWFFNSQAWWQDQGEDYFAQEHLHLGTCFPHAETLRGEVPFDVVIKLHNNPGLVTWVRIQIFLHPSDPNYSAIQHGCHGDGLVCYDFNPPYQCPPTTTDCTLTIPLTVNTANFPYDGLHEFRISTNIAKGSSMRQYQTNGWRARLANGKPVKPVNFDPTLESVEGRGWHTGANYTNARLNSFPKAPVSGTWTIGVRLDRGADGTPVTDHEVLIDPDIHAGSRGVSAPITIGQTASTTPYQGTGRFSGTISIDTRTLTNGPHKLLLRAGSTISAPPGTNSGVTVVPFTVQN